MLILTIGVVVTVVLFLLLSYDTKLKVFKIRARCIVAFIAGALILGSNAIAVLPANRVGVLYDPFRGGTQNEVLGEGINFKAPWNEVYIMSTSIKLLT